MENINNLPSPSERKIFFSGLVDDKSMEAVLKKIIELNEEEKYLKKFYKLHNLKYISKPIKIYIDSYGGYVYNCLGLLSVIDSSKIKIHTIVTGCAMSCGFMIAIHGHKRFAYKNSTLMYHQISSGNYGTVKDGIEGIKENIRMQKIFEKIIK